MDWLRWFRRKPQTPQTVWVLDLEATGFDPRQDHILSLGMVPIRDNAIHWGERWYREVCPPAGIDPGTEAVTVHQLLPGELDTAPPLAEVLPELTRRLEGAVLGVHWGRLDLSLLRRAFRAANLHWPRPPVVDTAELLHRLDRRRQFLEPHPSDTPTQLAEARAFLGLPPHQEHHALYDALATAELLLVLRARLGLRRYPTQRG